MNRNREYSEKHDNQNNGDSTRNETIQCLLMFLMSDVNFCYFLSFFFFMHAFTKRLSDMTYKYLQTLLRRIYKKIFWCFLESVTMTSMKMFPLELIIIFFILHHINFFRCLCDRSRKESLKNFCVQLFYHHLHSFNDSGIVDFKIHYIKNHYIVIYAI